MARAVRFHRYGGVEELTVDQVPRPIPGPGQALVRVRAAAINPGETHIRTGALHQLWPATFPSGEGSDLAGVVAEVGAQAGGFRVGDEVLGFTDVRASHADYVLVQAGDLAAKPAGLSWERAGSLYVAGTTAYAAVRSVGLSAGETVVVTGAAGGVGSLAVQLARRGGATVVGLASAANHDWLAGLGVVPVTYGEGVLDRIRDVLDDRKPNAFIDTRGDGYVELALDLGVAPDRIDTIADREGAARHGTRTEGNMAAATIGVVSELAELVAAGELELPIAATYPLDQVREAFTELERGHTRGKIVLVP